MFRKKRVSFPTCFSLTAATSRPIFPLQNVLHFHVQTIVNNISWGSVLHLHDSRYYYCMPLPAFLRQVPREQNEMNSTFELRSSSHSWCCFPHSNAALFTSPPRPRPPTPPRECTTPPGHGVQFQLQGPCPCAPGHHWPPGVGHTMCCLPRRECGALEVPPKYALSRNKVRSTMTSPPSTRQ